MTAQAAHDRPATASALVAVADALRVAMADERRALAALDPVALEAATARKQPLLDELARLHARPERPTPDELRALTAARLEVAASATLVGAALTAVAAMLGYESDDCYDRLARRHTQSRPLRVVAY